MLRKHIPFLFALVLALTVTGDSAGTNGGEKLLQFTSAGHVLGFSGDGVIVASARHMLRIDFLNSRAVAPEAVGAVSGESSAGAAHALGRVTYRNVWDGVTVVYEASGASIVKSSYYVDATKERVQVARIRLGYNRPVRIDENGNLLVVYEDGTIVEGAPVAWQETESGRKPVTATYVLHGEREVGFSLSDYTPGIPVVIDPVMTWNTFLGGSGSDTGFAIAVDSSGNVYVGGYSSATWGSPVRAYAGNYDAFAAKLGSDGNFVPPWDSYQDSFRTTIDNDNVSPYTTAYMKGTSFANVSYLIAYYDANGVKRGSETQSASSGTLNSAYFLTTDPTAAANTWHALVQPNSASNGFGENSYATIVASPDTYSLLANDSFTVESSAIPEFPTVIAGIAVAGSCAAIYYWMRRKRLGGTPAMV